MFKGGYKIIDLKDTPLIVDGDAMMIEGIYDSIEASYRKPIMLAGLNINGSEQPAIVVPYYVLESAFVFTSKIGDVEFLITVQSTDAVTVTTA